ncbi:MAG: HD domain-containing phosphohydrolase [Pseudomonadota bacterium]
MARILIVDDELQIGRVLSRLLEGGGHTCVHVECTQAAREALAASSFELMLCDINMPGESGLDLARSVLKQRDDVAVVMSTAVDDAEVAEVALEFGAYGYLIKPASRNQVRITVSNALRRRELEIKHRDHQSWLERAVAERTRELRQSREDTIQCLARAAEFRDNETAEHNQRMSHYCSLLARRLGMSPERCEQIRLASVMHDVGKVGVSDRVLLKPGRLTDEEFAEIKTHPAIGHRILAGSSSPLLELGAVIALSHHEKYDGSGYPGRLKGEAIPIEGRLAAVADVFDALTTNRVYRDAWSLEKTLQLLVHDRGTHFDPGIGDLFMASLDEVLAIRKQHADRSPTDKGAISLSQREVHE